VGTGRIVTFCRGAAALSPLDRDDLYWVARASLISRPEDVEAFDLAFGQYFRTGVGFPPIAQMVLPKAPVPAAGALSVNRSRTVAVSPGPTCRG